MSSSGVVIGRREPDDADDAAAPLAEEGSSAAGKDTLFLVKIDVMDVIRFTQLMGSLLFAQLLIG